MIRPWHYLKAWREARDKSFAWKVRWRMRHDRNPLLSTLQDKVRVKEYARERGVASPDTLYVTEAPADIPFDVLPANYFIKANHGCGWNIACIESELYRYVHGSRFVRADGSRLPGGDLARYRLSRAECIGLCEKWLSAQYRAEEWAYRQIEPRIMVEEMVAQRGGGTLRNYKVFTMAGAVKAIKVAGPAFTRAGSDNLYFDADWNLFEMTRQTIKVSDPSLWARPDTLPEIVDSAERLGRGLDFVRADLYDTTRGVLLGEMTVYPSAGRPGTPAACPDFNKWLGDQWVLPAQGLG